MIPPIWIQNKWEDLRDDNTLDHVGFISFNDCTVFNYIDYSSARFIQGTWNCLCEIIERLLRINNHVEDFNRRMNSISVYLKRKKISENIDSMFEFHRDEYTDGRLPSVELFIKYREYLKITFVIK